MIKLLPKWVKRDLQKRIDSVNWVWPQHDIRVDIHSEQDLRKAMTHPGYGYVDGSDLTPGDKFPYLGWLWTGRDGRRVLAVMRISEVRRLRS